MASQLPSWKSYHYDIDLGNIPEQKEYLHYSKYKLQAKCHESRLPLGVLRHLQAAAASCSNIVWLGTTAQLGKQSQNTTILHAASPR